MKGWLFLGVVFLAGYALGVKFPGPGARVIGS